MNKLLVGFLSFVVGIILGGFGSSSMVGGAAGTGLALGLSSGMCSVAQAAQEAGLVTAEQVDQVMQSAAGKLAEIAGESSVGDITNSAGRCDEILTRLGGGSGEAEAPVGADGS